ncbi:PLP-dependent cysteine synthase family protein [Psychroflexus sediminis]|uniref:Cystathionine beta-synthase n=1 Tax=Psychroflexus sediminis TaxID=470826 RepID=A0A1G7XH81_9FLAO|nr:pyridoxal-phosphate dependent enzyme [Psychroflexus sediminis]SDG82960.1 cystathionine beta-synthase [Psychroflexus sediminis]
MHKNLNVHDSLLSMVGCTPLIRLKNISQHFQGEFLAKYEAQNPGLSSKDRIAHYIIEKAEQNGDLKPGDTIIETTSGNTGFSIAMVAAIKGYKCILAVSSKSSKDKISLLKTMGADVRVCPSNVAPEDPRSYYEVAKRIHSETPGSIYINQYFNDLNIDAHYLTTGPEIWAQTEGEITHLVACSGTGGTISGTARYLKEKNPNIRILGIDAFGSVLQKFHETGKLDKSEIYPYKIEGLGKNLIPTATDFSSIDKFTKVSDEDSAYMARDIARAEGMFVGYTSGAVMQGVKQLDEEGEFDSQSKVVVIFPDHGSRYMSKVFSDEWMKAQGFTNYPGLKEEKTNGKILKNQQVTNIHN